LVPNLVTTHTLTDHPYQYMSMTAVLSKARRSSPERATRRDYRCTALANRPSSSLVMPIEIPEVVTGGINGQ